MKGLISRHAHSSALSRCKCRLCDGYRSINRPALVSRFALHRPLTLARIAIERHSTALCTSYLLSSTSGNQRREPRGLSGTCWWVELNSPYWSATGRWHAVQLALIPTMYYICGDQFFHLFRWDDDNANVSTLLANKMPPVVLQYTQRYNLFVLLQHFRV